MKLTTTQIQWLKDMRKNLEILHEEWYGGYLGISGQHFNNNKFNEVNRKIRLACSRLGIEVIEAFDPDGWDGERFQPLETLFDAIRSIEKSGQLS